ncbi:hypothetical protein [Aquimonas sp.]|jgi:hypothetical protein|uniref:hypothetical protein n=1 Tax=Aquimonas sp. TaxID=1872588 RepID=UPI0037C03B21
MRLTDWVVKVVEDSMRAQIQIPTGMPFSALRLARDADGCVSFDSAVIVRICEASNIDPALFFRSDEGNVAQLIMRWYAAARSDGEPADPIAEDLIGEARIEDARGQHSSLSPGRS